MKNPGRVKGGYCLYEWNKANKWKLKNQPSEEPSQVLSQVSNEMIFLGLGGVVVYFMYKQYSGVKAAAKTNPVEVAKPVNPFRKQLF